MPEPADRGEAAKHFLDITDAEVVHGPDVVAGDVSRALRDAERFGLPHVKPPLSDALGKAKRAASPDAGSEAAEQNALSGVRAEVDARAGSADVLKPAGSADPA